MSETDPTQPNRYVLEVQIEDFEVNGLSSAFTLFELLEESAEIYAKHKGYQPEEVIPIYKVEQ